MHSRHNRFSIGQMIAKTVLFVVLLAASALNSRPVWANEPVSNDIQQEAMRKVTPQVIRIVLNKLTGQAPSANDVHFVRRLLMPQMCIPLVGDDVQVKPETYLEEVADMFRPYYQAMVDAGGEYENGPGKWNLDDMVLGHEELMEEPALATAIHLFFSPKAAKTLLEECRTQPVVLGDYVVSPGKGYSVRTVERWKSDVDRMVGNFNRTLSDYGVAVQLANTWWGATEGAYWRTKGSNSPDQIVANGLYESLLTFKQIIFNLGVSEEIRNSIFASIRAANNAEADAIAGLVATTNRVTGAMIAAPLIPIAIYAAPFAGALVGVGATTATNASATLALFPAALGLAYSGVAAGVNNVRYDTGNGFLRDFVDNSAAYGAGGLIVAPFLASLPSAMYLASATTGGVVALHSVYVSGSIGQAFGAYGVTSTATLGMLQITAATGFISYMGYSAYTNANEALTHLSNARRLAAMNTESSAAAAQVEFANAETKALFAAIDIAFFAYGGVKFVKSRPIHTMGRLVEAVRIKPVAMPEPILELSTSEGQLARIAEQFPGRDGAKTYWGERAGEAFYDAIKAETGPAVADKIASNPTIAPWAETPMFRSVISNLKAEANATGSPVGEVLTPQRISLELGKGLGDVIVQRALRLDAAAVTAIRAQGLRVGAVRNGVATTETFRGMLRARLGGNRGNIGNSEMQPEVNSNYNSVSDYADLAVSVASCESGVSATAGKLPIYLVEMMVPKNQIVSLGGTLEYPAGSYWASHHAAGSNAVSVYRFDPSSGSLQSTNTYRANGATEAFLFGEVSASRIRSITPIAEGEYTFELHER